MYVCSYRSRTTPIFVSFFFHNNIVIVFIVSVPEVPPRHLPGSSVDSDTGIATMSNSKSRFSFPMKLATRKSRTSLAVPARFDTVTDIQRSNSLPKQDLRRFLSFNKYTTILS